MRNENIKILIMYDYLFISVCIFNLDSRKKKYDGLISCTLISINKDINFSRIDKNDSKYHYLIRYLIRKLDFLLIAIKHFAMCTFKLFHELSKNNKTLNYYNIFNEIIIIFQNN